jgi:hypothetical protein
MCWWMFRPCRGGFAGKTWIYAVDVAQENRLCRAAKEG